MAAGRVPNAREALGGSQYGYGHRALLVYSHLVTPPGVLLIVAQAAEQERPQHAADITLLG